MSTPNIETAPAAINGPHAEKTAEETFHEHPEKNRPVAGDMDMGGKWLAQYEGERRPITSAESNAVMRRVRYCCLVMIVAVC
jgi:hypothetical protein